MHKHEGGGRIIVAAGAVFLFAAADGDIGNIALALAGPRRLGGRARAVAPALAQSDASIPNIPGKAKRRGPAPLSTPGRRPGKGKVTPSQ